MFTVYILQSKTSGRYYIGQTANIQDRLVRHNNKRELATKNRGPWEIVYQENYLTRSEAMKREKQIKSYKSGNGFKLLLLKNK